MRGFAVALAVVLSSASAGCASGTGSGSQARVAFDREAETRSVYAAILNELYARDWVGREVEQWVVDPDVPAVVGGRDELVRNRVSDARPDTLADYERARPAAKVPADLAPGRPVRWFPRSDFDRLLVGGPNGGWPAFHQTFPRSSGLVTMSRIGFSDDGTEALVQPGCWFDSLGGSRTIVRLRKAGGSWRVAERRLTAVS